MTTQTNSGAPSPRGVREKRRSILRAARLVFGRLGYLGASIEAIATEAAVSTRTIYNHFENKEQLFTTVLTASSTEVAEAREELINRHLDAAENDLENALIGLSREWLQPHQEFEDHFALVRHIRADTDRFSPEVIAQWRNAGPLRARRALAAQFSRLADKGLLAVDDPDVAAQHFMALTTSVDVGRYEFTKTATPEQVDRVAVAGVRAFLRGYGSRE